LGGEGSSDGGLSFRETDSRIGLFEGGTVIGPISAHSNLLVHSLLEELDEVGLIVRGHSGVNLGIH
jgi:hypothetical protein